LNASFSGALAKAAPLWVESELFHCPVLISAVDARMVFMTMPLRSGVMISGRTGGPLLLEHEYYTIRAIY